MSEEDYLRSIIGERRLARVAPNFPSLQPEPNVFGADRKHNVLVKELLDSKGEGRVLVIDGGGNLGRPLVGGILAQLGVNNGWAGIVVNGCIRDVDEINACGIGVRALTTHPLKPTKKGAGDKHIPAYIAGSWIREGEWLYVDGDGDLISKSELSV